jgi:hypothetical protein
MTNLEFFADWETYFSQAGAILKGCLKGDTSDPDRKRIENR